MPQTSDRDQFFWNIFFSALFVVLAAWLAWSAETDGLKIEKIPWSHWLVLTFSVFRLIRLFVYDSVTAFIREYLKKFSGGPRLTLSNLINCPWCTGIWMALLVTYLYFFIPGALFFLFVLALAGMGSSLQIIIRKISL